MLSTRRILVLMALSAWCSHVTPTMACAQSEVKVIKGIRYGAEKEGKSHQLDLYLPTGKGFPVVVMAHGGAWATGDKGEYEYLGQYLAQRGIGVAVANYRLSPKVRNPGPVQDLAKAVAWVHANIGKHGGNHADIQLLGYSAGGHLVSLLGTDEKYLQAEGLGLHTIRGVISISGVYAADKLPALHLVFPRHDRDTYFPIHHVKAGRPSFVLLHAETEIFGLDQQARQFHRKLVAAKCEASITLVKGTNHFDITNDDVFRARYGSQIVACILERKTVAKAGK